MKGEEIIAFLVKLLEDQEQIKITYELGGDTDDGSKSKTIC